MLLQTATLEPPLFTVQQLIINMEQTEDSFVITLKTTTKESTEITVTPKTTVLELKTQLSQKSGNGVQKIKLIYKGKIIENNQSLGSLEITYPTVIMVVYSKIEKKEMQQPSIGPILTKLQTGLGDFNPVGFGNFGIMNQPGYMSALASVASPEKMEEMMDDPFYQKMVEDMMNDPETMIKMMQDNPMTRQMMQGNPMMKMMMNNPEMMKAIMTPENMKMAMEMKKQQDSGVQPQGLGGMGGMGAMGGLGGMGGFGNMGALGNMGMGGFNPWMGSANQQANTQAPNLLSGPNMTSPSQPQTNTNTNQQSQPNSFLPNPQFMGMNPYMNPIFGHSMMNPMMNSGSTPNTFTPSPTNAPFYAPPQQDYEQLYKTQLSTLESMGFSDKGKNIEALKLCLGNVQAAIERLVK